MKYRKSTGDQPTGIYTWAHRWKLMMLFCLAAVCISLAISACDFRKVDASAETNSKEESNMESIQTTTTIQHKIPPIDAAVLPETETATFALG
ncbi:MAG: hypothetical protein JSW26_17625 [Desulfobacterales bacterium]|nr:MAG: hypothetical protein JSW26_17625 [Desulfobacterales bacterium]